MLISPPSSLPGNYVLGLDFGTSGARACVLDEAEAIVHEDRYAYPNAAAQTPLDWREAMHTLLKGLPDALAAKLQGIAIAATSATVLLCDEALEPISPALLYSDNRAHEEAHQVQQLAPPEHIVGSVTSGLAKFLWLTRHTDPAQAVYFLHQADWLAALLTGRGGISDYHNALKTGYDVEHLCWPEWIQRMAHFHLLPQVVAPGTALALIHPTTAQHFRLNPACTVYAGTTDSIAAFMAAKINQPGMAVTSLGSTLVLKLLSKRRVESAQYGVYSHRYGDLWLAGGASNSGGNVLRYYFNDAQLAVLSQRINTLPMQDSPLVYYPLLRPGERFPLNDPALAPRLTPRPADDAEFLQGMLHSMSRIEAAGYARLAELGATPLASVATSGGGAQNQAWQQMRAKALSVPVTVAYSTETAFGAALLARHSGKKLG